MILCKRCATFKSPNEFHSSKRHKSGKHCWCKKCCIQANILYKKQKRMAQIKPVKEDAVFPDAMAKRCGRCLEVKSFTHFYKSASSLDGYQSYCSKCNKAYDKEQQALKKAKRNFDKTERKNPQTQSQYNSTTYFESLRGGKENAGRPSNDLFDLTPSRIEFLNIQRDEWRKVFAERHDDVMGLIRAYEAEPDNSVALITAFHQDTRPKWKLQHKSIKQSKTEYYEFLREKYATRTIGGDGCGDETNRQ
jgi:hypothetical protein